MSSLKYRAGGANRFLRIDDRGVVEDCIIPASSVGPSAPAPLALSVDPSTPSDGVTHFVGIQEAIDSLGGRLLQNTVITIAAGTYAENVVVPQGLGVGSGFQLQLMGDSRDISGCGINAGSGWNTAVGAAPIGGCPG